MAQNGKIQVMLSYHHNSKQIVQQIFNILKKNNIPVYFNDRDSINTTVDEANVICCFMTPEYQDSIGCKNELQYAKEKNKYIIPCMIGDKENKQWKPTDWLKSITTGFDYIDFQEQSVSNILLKTEELINRIINRSSTSVQYNLLNVIKEKYLKEDVFPIEQSYISLCMVHTKDKATKYSTKIMSNLEKEQGYHWKHHYSKTLSVYEEIYGDKTPIDIKWIFSSTQNCIKRVLILGRSTIGKSTFCQYITYQWAKGKFWSQYEFVVLIDMLKLTDARYPATKHYTVVDLVEREYAPPFGNLSMTEKQSFQQKCDNGEVLWILDGYDECTGNVSEQLKQCLKDILEKQHYILTSSSYDITVSCDIKLEITGYMHTDIPRYVEHFFHRIEAEKLLDFLYSNRSIYRVASIPVNLELICRLWVDSNQLRTKTLTMTGLYEEFVVWLCRRQINKDNNNQEQFNKELQFLEYLAFKTVQSDEIILSINFLQETAKEIGYDSSEYARILQMNILKLYEKKSSEATEQYYFIHPSYQQFFAAHHLLKTLKSSNDNEALHFISHQKYNERFRLMFIFAAGLLAESDYQSCIDKFWTAIQGEPIDICGLQHLQLLTECIDELDDSDVFDNQINILHKLWKLFETFLSIEVDVVQDNVIATLSKTSTILRNRLIQNNLAKLLLNSGKSQKCRILHLFSQFPVLQPTEQLFSMLLSQLRDSSISIREEACIALGNIHDSARIKQLTGAFIKALSDNHRFVRIAACKALGKFSEKAVTDKVISSLIKALGANDRDVGSAARDALVKLGEKVTTNLIIDRLIHTLFADENFLVRREACEALGKIVEKTPTKEIITAIIDALNDKQVISVNRTARNILIKFSQGSLSDEVITSLIHTLASHENYTVRENVCKILIEIAEKAPTNEVLNALINALDDRAFDVSHTVHQGLMKLGKKVSTDEMIAGLMNVLHLKSTWSKICFFQIVGEMGEKAARNDVLTILVNGIADEDADVRKNACQALRKFGEKATTKDVIVSLVNALRDNNADVRKSACEALGKVGGKAARTDVLSALVNALEDKQVDVRKSACEALGNIGEKAATNDIVASLNKALRDRNIQENAYEALQKIGDGAATDKVLNVFIHAMDDEDVNVRRSACQALGSIGEKAITVEVITILIRALDDRDWNIQGNARKALVELDKKIATYEVITCITKALSNANDRARENICSVIRDIGAKAATKDTITALFNQFTHENRDVQNAACDVLKKLGEKAVNNDLIAALIEALVSKDSDIQGKACSILSHIDSNAVTNEMIAALHNTLDNKDKYMEYWVCRALSKIGSKALNDKVIDYLVNMLNDNSSTHRSTACETLAAMGEKAITDKMLDSLVSALRDKCVYLREEVCTTLGKLGKKAATKKVLIGLINALPFNRNYPQCIREKICKALENMGEKAVTNEVLAGLVEALRNKEWNMDISKEVCITLGKMGEKAATNAVLEGLMHTIHAERSNRSAGDEACKTLVKFGSKAATNEIITCLLDVLSKKNVDYYVECEARSTVIKLGEIAKTSQVIGCLVERFLNKVNDQNDEYMSKTFVGAMSSYDALKNLNENMIAKLTQCLKQCKTIKFEMMPRNQCINVFLETKNNAWIPLVHYMTLLQNVAVTVMNDQITIYDGRYITVIQVIEPELLNVFDKIKTSYAHITIKPTLTSDSDLHQALAELEQSALSDINNRELSCKGHPCPNCGLCRDWYFTGTVEELDWLRDEQNWEHKGKAWNRWCDGNFRLKFIPRNEKTCTGRYNFIFPFTIGKYDDGFHAGKGDFPHGPVGYARAVPFANDQPYDYDGYYSDFCVCEDNIKK